MNGIKEGGIERHNGKLFSTFELITNTAKIECQVPPISFLTACIAAWLNMLISFC